MAGVAGAGMSLCGAVCASGCASDTGSSLAGSSSEAGAGSPFAPKEMRIYPLTHVERVSGEKSADGARSRIVCHLEFVDRWFDTCKAVGRVELEIYRPGGGLNPGVDVRAGRWDIDLTNLERNAEWFDPVTRTYRLQLDVPVELEQVKGANVRLRAVFTPLNGGAGGAVLQDEFALRG